MLVVINYSSLTLLGLSYFISEMVVIGVLVYIELRTALTPTEAN